MIFWWVFEMGWKNYSISIILLNTLMNCRAFNLQIFATQKEESIMYSFIGKTLLQLFQKKIIEYLTEIMYNCLTFTHNQRKGLTHLEIRHGPSCMKTFICGNTSCSKPFKNWQKGRNRNRQENRSAMLVSWFCIDPISFVLF